MATTCAPLTDTAIKLMQRKLNATVPGPPPRNRVGAPGHREYVSRLYAFDWACIDQEAIILFDPRLLADKPSGGEDHRAQRRGRQP